MSSNIIVIRVCEYCGNQFEAKTTFTRFCSRSCNGKNLKDIARQRNIDASNLETNKAISIPYEILNSKPFLNVTEVSKLIGVSSRTIFRLIKIGKLSIKKVGRRTLITKEEIKRYFSN